VQEGTEDRVFQGMERRSDPRTPRVQDPRRDRVLADPHPFDKPRRRQERRSASEKKGVPHGPAKRHHPFSKSLDGRPLAGPFSRYRRGEQEIDLEIGEPILRRL